MTTDTSVTPAPALTAEDEDELHDLAAAYAQANTEAKRTGNIQDQADAANAAERLADVLCTMLGIDNL